MKKIFFLFLIMSSLFSNELKISGIPFSAAKNGILYTFTPQISNDEKVSYYIKNKPSWIDFDDSVGSISGIPLAKDIGIYKDIKIFAKNDQNISKLKPFSIEVYETNKNYILYKLIGLLITIIIIINVI